MRSDVIFADEQIHAALVAARSVNQAAKRLGMARSALEKRCRRPPWLAAAYAECVKRGLLVRTTGPRPRVRRVHRNILALTEQQLDDLEREAAAE